MNVCKNLQKYKETGRMEDRKVEGAVFTNCNFPDKLGNNKGMWFAELFQQQVRPTF
jgi:hypothetical protein